MNTDPSKPIGFRPTQPFGNDPRGVGWRVWIGPLILCRVRHARLGLWLGWHR